MSSYAFNEIEKKWQDHWEENKTFRTPDEVDTSKPKFYVLDMFPYPSGVGLHVGHPLGYIATDIVARYKRMLDTNVLHPMGFDAFGLPAEQYAVEHGVHPRITTDKNIQNMLRQLKRLGLSYDWDRMFSTTDTDYYKWTQWIFLKLFNSYFDEQDQKAKPISELIQALTSGTYAIDGEFKIIAPNAEGSRSWNELDEKEQDQVLANYRLAYMAEVPVNWCPGLGTVLANEEVTNEGRSERGNFPVFKRPLRQWMMRITAFADRLIDELDDVEWPEPVKMMQRNWIGRSKGAFIEFQVKGHDQNIKVFTTRPDTVFGATYMVLAPEHPLVDQLTTNEQKEKIADYQTWAASRSEIERLAEGKEKTGVFTGAYAINPVNNTEIPIWIADYVLAGYGTGAIMAVPGQDERDWEFAETFDLPIIRTVQPPEDFDGKAYTGNGPAINSDFLNGLKIKEAKHAAIEWLSNNNTGEGATNFKLRDWLFSRQRYWGEPFPILHHPDGIIKAIDVADLPVTLPEMEDFSPSASEDPNAPPVPPLGRSDDSWKFIEIDGVVYARELNTMPQWAGSCWYYIRFIDPQNANQFVDPDKEKYWLGENGVDLYVGGSEHAVLHLLYSRFWHKVLYDLSYVTSKEPFGRYFSQGYIQAFAYRDERGIAVPADDVIDQDGNPATEVQDQNDRQFSYKGSPVTREYGKMGKSLKNAVSPDEVCDQYGCDTLRLYEMYMGPLDASKPWNTRDIIGSSRFLRRVWRNYVDENTGESLVVDAQPSDDLLHILHKTIKRVTESMDRLSFNTAIAALIELNNALVSLDKIPLEIAKAFTLMLAPLAPHISEELWERMGHSSSLAHENWPKYEERYVTESMVEIAVQINGKVRGTIKIPVNAPKELVLDTAKTNDSVSKYLEEKTLRREIYVPGKIVNLVVN
ncbi:MAG: leucine--tRNA ligase [Rhodothermaceae bacterium]|nr:leucine--tRNA ligase [Rhodothermaceae bacterium]